MDSGARQARERSALWDVWAAYDATADGVFLREKHKSRKNFRSLSARRLRSAWTAS